MSAFGNSILRKRKMVLEPFFLIAALSVFIFFGMFCCSSQKASFVFNHSFFIVGSSSMEPSYRAKTLIVIKKEPFENLKEGDVIVFKSDALNGALAFHRVIKITSEGLYTKGDNNEFEDNQLLNEKSYVGKGISQNYLLGSYFCAIKNPFGLFLFLILPIISANSVYILIKRILQNENP